MTQYISKSDLVAEIKKRECLLDLDSPLDRRGMVELELIKEFINTLEVKEFKVEPKFKVGDIIKHNKANIIRKVISVNSGSYYVENIEGGSRVELFNAEQSFHLWSIQDVKDGDVLCIHSSESDSDCVFLYKNTVEIESGRNVAVAYCSIDVYANRIEFGIQGPDCIDVRKIKPATKEQRDHLFIKMKEAGYKWDAKDKVLKEIEQTPTSYFYCKHVGTTPKCGDCVRNHLNSKYKIEDIKTWMTPASRGTKQCSDYIPKDSVKWSEEDENIINHLLAICSGAKRYNSGAKRYRQFAGCSQDDVTKYQTWLKSIKERIQQYSITDEE